MQKLNHDIDTLNVSIKHLNVYSKGIWKGFSTVKFRCHKVITEKVILKKYFQ